MLAGNTPWRKKFIVLIISFQSRNFFYYSSLFYTTHYKKQKTKLLRKPEISRNFYYDVTQSTLTDIPYR